MMQVGEKMQESCSSLRQSYRIFLALDLHLIKHAQCELKYWGLIFVDIIRCRLQVYHYLCRQNLQLQHLSDIL